MKKTKSISTSLALAFLASVTIATGTAANADPLRVKSETILNEKSAKKHMQVPADFAGKKTNRYPSSNQIRDNVAHAWTAGCYAEFGPKAKWPDAALLQKCLDT